MALNPEKGWKAEEFDKTNDVRLGERAQKAARLEGGILQQRQ